MKLSTTLLLAVLLLPTFGSCGGGESVSPPVDSDSTTAPETETATEQAPAEAEEAAKTESGMDELEALENLAAGAVEAKEAVIPKAAQALYDSYCFACHGATGKGDGLAAANLPVKPASFVDTVWQASVTDEHLALVIAEGGAAAGKSPLMVPAPGAKDDPELLNGLIAIVRAFGE